jgi:hypothetical protein
MKCLVLFTADLDVLENYTGTPFLPSDSDILLDSPDQDDIGNRGSVSHPTLERDVAILLNLFLLFFFLQSSILLTPSTGLRQTKRNPSFSGVAWHAFRFIIRQGCHLISCSVKQPI